MIFVTDMTYLPPFIMHVRMHIAWFRQRYHRNSFNLVSRANGTFGLLSLALDTKLKLFRWYLCRNQAICILTCIMNGGKYVISVTNIISCHTVPIGWVIQRYHLLQTPNWSYLDDIFVEIKQYAFLHALWMVANMSYPSQISYLVILYL